MLGTSWILTWGCRVSSVIAMGVWGWYRPCRDEDLASRLPTSQTRHQRARHRQCGAHMGGSQDFSVKTCFLAFLCPIRPGSPAPSRDHREAAGTYRDQQWVHTADIQLLNVGPGSCQSPFFLHGDTLTCSKLVAIVCQGWF